MIKPCTGIPIDVIKRQFYKLACDGRYNKPCLPSFQSVEGVGVTVM
jgi:hypothetical protein